MGAPVRKGTLRIFKWPSLGGVGRQGRCDVQDVQPTAGRSVLCVIGWFRPIRTEGGWVQGSSRIPGTTGCGVLVQRSTKYK